MNPQYPELKDAEHQKIEGVTDDTNALALPVDDKTLIEVITQKISAADAYYKSDLKLYERTKLNVDFWRGKQIDESKLDTSWQIPVVDNVIHQNEETRIAIASGRMPDIVVTPSDEDPAQAEWTRQFRRGLESKVKNDVTKRIIKDGIRNKDLHLRSCIKIRWNKNLDNGKGDFEYILVHPDKVMFDHTSTIPHDGYTADNMEWIAEWLEEPLGVVLAKFPDKKEELFKRIEIVRGTKKQMISKIKYQEIWFTWYMQDGTICEGVAWKYKDLVLGKMKNPYYDWEGYEKEGEGTNPISNEPYTDTVFRNHFDRPRKPYIFLSHTNLGNSAVDDTSPVEQAIPVQRLINKRRRQITEIADRAVPKNVFSGEGITKEEARRVTQDPNESIWLDGVEDVDKAFASIPASPPPPLLIAELKDLVERIDGLFATHGTTRGEVQPSQSGISKQITREGDLTISDDIVEILVCRAVYEMANWAVQFMKVMYDQEHHVRETGRDGEQIHAKLHRDEIPDGLAVHIKASTVDRQTRRSQSLQLASAKGIDPLTLYEDLDVANPKEKTKRLLLFLSGEADGFTRYFEAVGIEAGGPSQTTNDSAAQATKDFQTLQQGGDVEITQPPDEEYVGTFSQLVANAGIDQFDPIIQQKIKNHVAKLKQMANNGGNAPNGAVQPPTGGSNVPQ